MSYFLSLIIIIYDFIKKETKAKIEHKIKDWINSHKSHPLFWAASQISAGLNLETLNTILCGINHIWAASQIYAMAYTL